MRAVKSHPKPHPPAAIKDGVCTACWRHVLTRAGLETRCAAYGLTAGYPERPARKRS